MVEQLINQIEKKQDMRTALSTLRSEIKEEKKKSRALELLGEGTLLISLLTEEDAKVRKNTAALLADLQIEQSTDALFRAYQTETQMFVRPAYLKALEKLGAYPYLEELKERYDFLYEQDRKDNEKKHIIEELRALERILRKEGKNITHTFCGWNEKVTILLTTNAKYQEITANQLHAYRTALTSLGVKAVVDDLREVVQIRTFRELLFPISLKKSVSVNDRPEIWGEALAETKLLPFLEKCHRESAPFYFRLEIRSGLSLEERSKYAKKAAVSIEEKSGRKLLNSTEEYEFEIRILADKEGKLHVFLKMNTIPMERFSYRKHTIAASIHPSAAAMLMELAKPYLKEHAQILDPCCGVGTMLVERHKLLPAREIYGIDIFGEAIEKARENCAHAGMRVNFIHRDYLDFKHEYLFDEIISNMPVRGKKSKEEQDAFYRDFFTKSKEILAPGGDLILYSNEAAFIKKQIRLNPEFWLKKEYMIRSKDQFALFIIGMREK